ncbi:hypothetical protein CHC07_01832 [Variovorax sp. B4]|nr:hypothetical protein CHC07_01832 [Variovorax sp. B4]PNG60104.1 hypothetical protein CHC06_00001 [Variovorax sp. B2]
MVLVPPVPSVTVPRSSASPVLLVSVPPIKSTCCAIPYCPPRSRVPPLFTVAVAVSAPRPRKPLSRRTVPALIVTPPVWVLSRSRVNVPVPILISPPFPDITPLKVVLVLSPPAVSVPVPRATKPKPARLPMVWLKLLRSSVAPPPSVTALAALKAFAAPARRVPALRVVVPA